MTALALQHDMKLPVHTCVLHMSPTFTCVCTHSCMCMRIIPACQHRQRLTSMNSPLLGPLKIFREQKTTHLSSGYFPTQFLPLVGVASAGCLCCRASASCLQWVCSFNGSIRQSVASQMPFSPYNKHFPILRTLFHILYCDAC